ncbi:HNH endonuclease [candidate division KSB1 bacterium]|nr:HNH endonuclease [candidate division KSB1 bacterium]
MSKTYIPESVRQRVAEAARYRCGYCQTLQDIVGYPLHVEHIIPEAADGSSAEENLWLACLLCNNHKGSQTHAKDPVTQTEVPLFNPRTQVWAEHFAWIENGTQIVGSTAIGRATILALKLNAPVRIHARRRWASVGWHPPRD